jgi:hypothetical protein
LLAGVAAGLVGGGCSSDAPPPRPVALGSDPVVSQRYVGGMVALGHEALTGPLLAVYHDGLAIAHATSQTRVSTARVDDMVTGLIGELDDGAGGTRSFPPPTGPSVDAPATEIVVRGARHTYTVTVDLKVAAAWDWLGALYRDASDGEPYRSSRVRVVVSQRDPQEVGTPLGWPAGVPVPVIGAGQYTGSVDLDGPAAAAALALPIYVPGGSSTQWQVFRTSNGGEVRAAVRYLLPHE